MKTHISSFTAIQMRCIYVSWTWSSFSFKLYYASHEDHCLWDATRFWLLHQLNEETSFYFSWF